MIDLVAIYRACGNEVENPKPFRLDGFSKFKCWDSFYSSFSGKCQIEVVWDGDKNELFDYISNFQGINIHCINEKSNQGSLEYCFQVFEKVKNNFRYVYLVEDDHFHLLNAYKVLIDGLSLFSEHFICTGDHIDRYRMNNGDIISPSELYLGKLSRWRIVESYVFTFAARIETFAKFLPNMRYYNNIGTNAVCDREFFRFIIKNNYRLFSPIPGVSTHCVKHDTVFWEQWEKLLK